MEAVGQLAGGVAHDFNNLLSVILGFADLLATSLDEPRQQGDLAAIVAAVERASELVRQLLAFSRRQALSVRIADLNDFLRGEITMLRRVLPASIRVEFAPFAGPLTVAIDAAQIEQVLLSLVINAQHAIGTRDGLLRLETARVDADAVPSARADDAARGARAAPSGPAGALHVGVCP